MTLHRSTIRSLCIVLLTGLVACDDPEIFQARFEVILENTSDTAVTLLLLALPVDPGLREDHILSAGEVRRAELEIMVADEAAGFVLITVSTTDIPTMTVDELVCIFQRPSRREPPRAVIWDGTLLSCVNWLELPRVE